MRNEPAYDATPSKVSALWAWVAVLGVVLSGFWATMFVVVPRQKRYYDEFGLMLPWVTKRLIDLASFFHDWWFVFVTGSVAAFVGLVVLTKANVFPRMASRRLAQLATILLLAILIVMGVALSLPMMKMAENLAR
jgi:type II secretory pathway component PulF